MSLTRVCPFYNPTQFQELISGRRKGFAARFLRGLLRVMEVPYTAAVELRNRRFDGNQRLVHRLEVPVISVGNVTTGGTGKTPLVAWLANWFAQRGTRVALISRGYGRPAEAGACEEGNDESRELAQRLPEVPHLQNPDRVAAAELAIQVHACDLIVLDDAFQHRRIHRDLDIVLLDALQPFGYGHLLPRGLLREPLHGLARAHLIALSRADTIDDAQRRRIRARVLSVAPQAAWIEMVHRPRRLLNAEARSLPVATLAGQRVAAFAGIGNPRGFRHSLEQLGCEVVAHRDFPDHFPYDGQDVADLHRWVSDLAPLDAVICTCKDLVKLDKVELGGCPLWALGIDVEVVHGLDVLERLLEPFHPPGR
ncbi:MAG: tetraacyldisaccharide 4'-kinase [Planctomycetota bacterium]